jgi:hypothetical protein
LSTKRRIDVRLVIANSFSLGMLPKDRELVKIKSVRIQGWDAAVEFLNFPWARIENCIRHEATSKLVVEKLGLHDLAESLRINVENVPSITLDDGTTLLVILPRWKGGRAPESKDYTLQEIEDLAEGFEIWVVEMS